MQGRKWLTAALAAAGMSALLAPGASALEACPDNTWNAIATPSVVHVRQFCQKGNMYVVRADQGWVGNTLEQVGQTDPSAPWGSSGNPNPSFQRKTAHNWISHLDALGYHPAIVINGTYFDNADLLNTPTTLSYPVWSIWQVAAGKTKAADGDAGNHRVCAGWGAVPKVHAWTYALNDWAGVDSFSINGPAGNGTGCMAGGQANALVAQEAGYKPQTTTTQATYMAFDNRVANDRKVCIAVAASTTRAAIQTTLAQFGCTSPVQLDGGNSSQISYYTLANHVLMDPVTSPIGRGVPHVLVVY